MTLAISWYFYDSARWFSSDTQRLASASTSLGAYQEIAQRTYRTLYNLNEAVQRGELMSPASVADEGESIRAAIQRARDAFDAEAAIDSGAVSTATLTDLGDIEAAAGEIVRSGLLIEAALNAAQQEVATAEFDRLRSEGTASRFSALIEQSLVERQAELDSFSAEAVSLADYVVDLLPIVMGLLIVLTGFVVWRFSNILSRSIGTLHQAVRQFSSGNLQHRIPDISEKEFQQLGSAFNHMAGQLSENRAELRDTNVRLEAMVDERTRALQDSNDKLARVDAHRRKLLADISHEFRTPLTVIKGESEIALRGKKLTKAEYRESFERIVDTADHATDLVDDLLFIVRADAGEPRLKMQTVELTEVLKGVCEEFGGKVAKRDIEIDYQGGVDRATLTGDARRLRQVFAILLDNAQRYSHQDGRIEVRCSAEDGDLVVKVLDEGIGLDAEESSQAFERFFRGEKAVAHAQQGTGLGLPVARAILKAHGGKIELEGRAERGAVATVRLPVEGSLRVVA